MSKPIFIIRIPAERIPAETEKQIISEQMRMLEKKLEEDYYLIPIIDSSVERVEFEYYNAINATNKDIEEIKQMVLKQLENE